MRIEPDSGLPEKSTEGRAVFRQEALTYVRTKEYGSVILARSVSHQVLTGLFALIAIGVIAFFAAFSTTRKAQTSGVLLPTSGVIRVTLNQSGEIVERRAREGQAVKAGEVLFVVRSQRLSGNGRAANKTDGGATDTESTISALLKKRQDSFGTELRQSAAQVRQRVAALQSRLIDIEAEIKRSDAQIALQQQRVALSEQNLKRFRELQATDFISLAQLQDHQAELIDQQQRLADLQRMKSTSQRELSSTQAELNDATIAGQRELAGIQRNVSALEQDLAENETKHEFLVTAPQDGMLTAMTAELGQTVVAGQAVAAILPTGSTLQADIYAPSRSVGFVKPGMRVLLRYQAYPYQKFGQHLATVREVASTSLRPEELTLPSAANVANGEPVYRIRLDLDKQQVLAYGKSLPLKSGMLVDASIMLEQRHLYEWVLEPLYSISGRM